MLVVDDDERFAATLAQALARRGCECARRARRRGRARRRAQPTSPTPRSSTFRLGADDGLALIEPLRRAHPQMRILVLTGYASIATAVKAIKLGADDYLAKPVTASAVVDRARTRRAARRRAREPQRRRTRRCRRADSSGSTSSACSREHDGNISATARTLRMHRRTLQRKLAKRPAQS